MAWFATVEEWYIGPEQGPLRFNQIIINISNTLNASTAENFITYSKPEVLEADVMWIERPASANSKGEFEKEKGGGDEGKG